MLTQEGTAIARPITLPSFEQEQRAPVRPEPRPAETGSGLLGRLVHGRFTSGSSADVKLLGVRTEPVLVGQGSRAGPSSSGVGIGMTVSREPRKERGGRGSP
jgi:hypothetical protein